MATAPHLIESQVPGHFFIEPPPKGFNLLRASPDELHQYGLPHRPDPVSLPNSAKMWTRTMRRIERFVVPKLVTHRDIVHGPIRGLRRIAGAGGTIHGGHQLERSCRDRRSTLPEPLGKLDHP